MVIIVFIFLCVLVVIEDCFVEKVKNLFFNCENVYNFFVIMFFEKYLDYVFGIKVFCYNVFRF